MEKKKVNAVYPYSGIFSAVKRNEFLKVQDVPGTKLGHKASRMTSLSFFLQQVHRYWVKSSEDGIGMVLLGHLITQQT